MSKSRTNPTGRTLAARISILYALLASVWVYTTDLLIARLSQCPQYLTLLQTYKGWLFVSITALLLYALLGNLLKAKPTAEPSRLATGVTPRTHSDGTVFSLWLEARTPILIFLLLASAIGATGYLLYGYQKASLQQQKQAELSAIADFKVKEIAHWLAERRKDAQFIARDPFLTAEIQRWFNAGAAADDSRNRLLAWLSNLKNTFDFSAVLLTDASAQVRLSVGDSQIHPKRQALVMQAIQTDQTLVTDLHQRLEAVDGMIDIDLVAPLGLGLAGDSKPVGALFIKIDSEQYLFPLIQTWPTPSLTAETLLVRQEGNDVVYLNELRHRKHTALKLRLPISDTHLPAAMALRGQEGIVEGKDYRQVPVLAVSRRVPGTSWFMIAKVDRDEVYAPIRTLALFLGTLVVIFITTAGTGTVLWWRQQRALFLTDYYQSEFERQKLVQQVDYLTRYANDMILLTDAEGQIIEANARAVSTYGYPYEELLGLNIRDLCPSQTKSCVTEHMNQISSSDGAVFETLHSRQDGTSFPVEVSARKLEIEGKAFVQSIIRDITERKRAEEQLRQREREFKALVEHAPDIIARFDRELRHLYVSPAITAVTGLAPEVLIGKTNRELGMDANLFQQWETVLRRVFATGRDDRIEFALPSPEGLHYYESHLVPEFSSTGAVQWVLGVSRDITARKLAENALREREARLRAIATAVPDVILVLDEDGHYLEILTSQPQLLYTDPELLKGKSMSEVLPPHLAERFIRVIQTTLLTRQIQVVEYELRIAKVRSRYFEARVAPLEALVAGKPAVVVVARDVTERKLTEEKLRQAQKMQAVGQLTGGVAHDFNNLLAIVLGNLELLEEQLADQADLQDLLHRAYAAAERGANLTRRLLAFSRQQPLQPKPTDLNGLIVGMTDLLKRTLGETIQVKTVLADHLALTIIDPTEFENVLLNLALNARDAMPHGGQLSIETANRWLDEDYARAQLYFVRTGQYVMLAVSDTGMGMEPEVLEHAFEPFFTTKAVGRGSGLGLSMVYGLVKQSGGYINIYSEPGKGTTIRIYLPQAKPESMASAETDTPELPLPLGRGETVLVVEDDTPVRQLTVSMLNSLGYHPVEADSARTALKVLEETPQVKLLFTDIVLPGGMSGTDLALQAQHLRPDLKVLFTSGYTEQALSNHRQFPEGAELLAKPYRKVNLAKKIHAMLGNN